MLWTNLSQREKQLLYATLSIIVFSLLFNFVFKPLNYYSAKVKQEILNKEIELKKNIRYLKQKDKISEVYQRFGGYARKGGKEEEEMTALLDDVEKTARSSGIHIANIKPKPIEALEFYKKYLLEMDCEATVEDYMKFIYDLQRSAKLISVEKLKLISQGPSNPLLKAQLVITKVTFD